jgi:hypothetical protein
LAIRFFRHFFTLPIFSPSKLDYHDSLSVTLVPAPAPVFPPLAVTFSPLRFAQGNPTFLTIRDEKTLLPRVAQHPLSLHFLAEALQQLILRLTLPQHDGCQSNSPPSHPCWAT